MASKRPPSIKTLDKFHIDQIIVWLSDKELGDLYVCYDCGSLLRGDPFYLCTSTSGDERSFCPKCVNHCYGCGNLYSSYIAWFHDDCKESE